MMKLLEKIDHDLKEAMKAKNEAALSALRLVRSALKNKQIDLQRELSDDEAQSVMKTMVKQYRDALADFTAAGRKDLADRQSAEIALLEAYLPAGMSEAELEALCKRVVSDEKATAKDLGRIMGMVMKEAAGRADGNAVRAIVQKLLATPPS